MNGIGSSRKGTATKAATSSENWTWFWRGERQSLVCTPRASKGCSVSKVRPPPVPQVSPHAACTDAYWQ